MPRLSRGRRSCCRRLVNDRADARATRPVRRGAKGDGIVTRSFLRELRRRKVFRVAAAYAVVGLLLIQVSTQVFPFFDLPNWSVRLIVLVVLAGFPIALVLAWAFDATPQGIVRTDAADGAAPSPASHRA